MAAGLAALQQLKVALAVAAIGMDEGDDSEHTHPSERGRESGHDSMLDKESDYEPKLKRTQNGRNEPSYYSSTVLATLRNSIFAILQVRI